MAEAFRQIPPVCLSTVSGPKKVGEDVRCKSGLHLIHVVVDALAIQFIFRRSPAEADMQRHFQVTHHRCTR